MLWVFGNPRLGGSRAASHAHVTSLEAGHCDLRGTIPPLDQLTALRHLVLQSNGLTGTMPFRRCTSLIQLAMGYNRLHGSLPDLTGLTALQSVSFVGNGDLEGNLQTAWASCSSCSY